jgi:curved DNA-binding protein CbpA
MRRKQARFRRIINLNVRTRKRDTGGKSLRRVSVAAAVQPMPDYFALLNQPRRPWLDADLLKEQFRTMVATHHPDVGLAPADETFAAMNVAFTTLRDPVARLRHLLELEFPEQFPGSQAIPSDLSDRFMRIAALRQQLASFRRKSAASSTPLTAALLANEKETLRRACEQQLAELEAVQQRALAELQALDAGWKSENAIEIGQLTALHQQLSYLAKWIGQLREDFFAVSE